MEGEQYIIWYCSNKLSSKFIKLEEVSFELSLDRKNLNDQIMSLQIANVVAERRNDIRTTLKDIMKQIDDIRV